MLSRLLSRVLVLALRSSRITGEDKAYITTMLLDNIGALPFRDTITFDLQGNVYVNQKRLNQEQLIALKESCNGLSNSFARNLIHEQVKYSAVKMGVHEGLNPDMILFAKAALWYCEQEDKLISTLMDA